MPIGFGMVLVAVIFPRGDFLSQGQLVWDPPIGTLRRQNAEFGLSHVKPTAVFRGVVPLEPFDEPACFCGGNGLVKRSRLVCVDAWSGF
jgi:hypothetical protein